MIIAKFILFVSPVVIASILFFANSAAASLVDSAAANTHINSASVQPVHELVLSQVDKSNPILDHLGCECAYCIGAQSSLQGKLPIPNIN
ncbi:MAG: hypothetical protein AAFV71_04910 [Cyanobacteria bacterium J06633_8]